jgi:pyrroline-5-carboxylate reductase
MKISFIGFGNMAKAIAEGFCKDKTLQLFAAAPSLSQGRAQNKIITHSNNKSVIENADIIVLAVKPVIVASVLKEIKSHVPKHCVIISIAAGISLEKLSVLCAEEQPIVRCMPNTPIAIGKGATALLANAYVSKDQKDSIETLFNYSGLTAWVTKESDMNVLTALSGSGPAYCFLFLETLSLAAQKLGLDAKLATTFALQTLSGAAALLETTKLAPEILRKKVTSPGGTTAAALAVLEQNGFENLVFNAMQAAYARALQLENQPFEVE